MSKPAAEAGAAAPAKSGNKMIIILLVVLILAVAGGAASFVLMGNKGQKKHKEEPVETAKKPPPVFAALDPFVVNLADEGGERFLQVGIAFEVKDNKIVELIKAYTPVLRSRILLVLTSKTVGSVSSIEGKQNIMDEILDMARETVHGAEKDKGIIDVHFSSFVIQ